MSDLPPPPPPPPPPGGYAGDAGAYGVPALAEVGPRVVAFLIDWIAIPIGGYIAILIVSVVVSVISDALSAIVLFLGWLAIIGYQFWNLYQEGTTGQTLGKKMQNVKLVGLENGGQPIGFGMAFVRYLINGIPCSLGWIFPFFDAQRQTLGDKVSKSVVVPS